MTGKGKAAILALLLLGFGWLIWSLVLAPHEAKGEQGSETSVSEEDSKSKQSPDAGANTESTQAEDVGENADSAAEGEGTDSQAVQRVEVVGKLKLMAPDGAPVSGKVELVKVNDTFKTHFATMSRIGTAIYYDSIVQEGEANASDGTMEVTAEGNHADFVIVVAPGFTPYLGEWEAVAPNEERAIELTVAKPIAVTVLTNDGQPIKDAQVWYRWTGVFSQNKSAPLLDRFRERFFQGVETTDAEGKVTLTSTFPDWSTQLFIRPGDLWATIVKTAEAGNPIEIRCPDAFMVTGIVKVSGVLPEQEVMLKASVHQGDQYWILESGRAKEEGRYKISGIPTGYPAYQVEAMGNGLANLTQDIFTPQPGSIVELDFHMVEGHGGTVKLKDPWGEPIANGRVKFVAEGDRSHMYGYNSDADGLVELPSTFRAEDSWWLNLRLGDNLYLRLAQPFQGGEDLEITVPNLARITEIKIAKDLLGEATIQEALWSGHSSQTWGTAKWTAETADTTMLASGSANLKITLSDGRELNQPIVLEPGSEGPITVDQLPATLSLELPSDPPASITIKTQNGITVFDQADQSGVVSIPLWQGRYSLLAIWPENARELPLIDLTKGDLDLGRIEATASGYLEGTVMDSSGNPIHWANVYLTSVSGYSSQTWMTEADGWYGFFDIPPGRYYILCDTSNSHASNSAMVIQEIMFTADRLEQKRDLVLPIGEQDQVRLTCGNGWESNSYAILATPSASSHAAVRSQGPTILSAQQSDGWLGAAQVLDGKITAQAMRVPGGGGEYTLTSAAMRSCRLLLVDEFGEPWRHLLMRLELNGKPLTRRPTLASGGSLEIDINADAPWSLQVCSPAGQVMRFEMSELKGTETLVVHREIQGQRFSVQDEAGDAIAWPTIQSADGTIIFPSNGNGEVIIPSDFKQALVVSADGFLPYLITDLSSRVISLPLRLDGIQVEVPSGAVRLSWTTTSPYRSLWQSEMGLDPGQTLANLPPMQAGQFHFTAWDSSGQVQVEQGFQIREDGQILKWAK